VLVKYLQDRKKRELPLDVIEHYSRVVKAVERTIEVPEKVEDFYLWDVYYHQFEQLMSEAQNLRDYFRPLHFSLRKHSP